MANLQTIGVLNYGSGNYQAIYNMISYLGYDVEIISCQNEIEKIDVLFIPGVGSFDYCMGLLEEKKFIQPILNFAESGKKIVGICVGMQILGHSSDEGIKSGLSLLNFKSVKFQFDDHIELPIPHVGWNEIICNTQDKTERYYFTHSYHAEFVDDTICWKQSHYGYDFTAAVKSNNIIGVQFHPEKSHSYGMALFEEILDNSRQNSNK